MKRCPNCGKNFPDDANFCPVNAGRLEPDPGETHRGHAPATGADAAAAGDQALGGRFDLGGPLGGGLTGEVFHARDREAGAACAAKLVHPTVFPSPLLLQRAERELKQLERLQLPEVARVLAHGRRGEQLWIAMELCGGTSLDKIIEQGGPMPATRACRIIRAVAHGLAEAAKQGVIHRDLAPKNVMVESSGVLDAVKIINFSIAVPSQVAADKAQGVPEFISPEQVEGKPADQRSSIYSLGALLYHAITGRTPFSGDAATVLRAHLQQDPPRPSQLAAVPPQLDTIVMRALEKASAKRFMTLQQFISELDGFLTSGAATQAPAAAQAKAPMSAQHTLMGAPGMPFGAPAPVVPSDSPYAVRTPPGIDIRSGEVVGAGAGAPGMMATMQVPPQQIAAMQQQMPPQMQPQAGFGGGGPMGQAPQAPLVVPKAPSPLPAPVPQAAAAGGAGKGKGKGGKPAGPDTKGKFRETMWFKKGELDAAAAQAAASAQEGDLVLDKADALPLEDRYKDDGSVGRQDAERFSLRTGSTQMMQAVQQPHHQGGHGVSEGDLAAEMKGGRGPIIIAVLVGLAIVIGILVYFAS